MTNLPPEVRQQDINRVSSPQRPEPAGVSGKVVLIASVMFLGLAVPVATWGCYLWVTSKLLPSQPLIWEQRTNWTILPAKPAALIKSGFLTPPKDGVYNTYELSLPDAQLPAIRETMTRALEPGFSLATWPGTIKGSDAWPLTFLKSIWLDQTGDKQKAEAAISQSHRVAPRAMRLRFITADQQPAAGIHLGSLIATMVRTDAAGSLDESVKLVYPNAITDDTGSVWLPIDHTPVKLNTRPEIPGYEARWFADAYYDFPSQAGAWPDVVLIPQPE